MSNQTFGELLRELRKAKSLTQRDLAEKVSDRLLEDERRGFDFTYLSKIENGKTPPPSVGVIQKLAEVLDADASELITHAGKVPAELGETLRENEAARAFFRSAFSAKLEPEEWKDLLKHLIRKTEGEDHSE